ncbi:MAG: sigma-70 family RNA polymerase sigma factor [Planctomycetota bacterium]
MDRATFEQLAIEHMDAVYRMAMQLAKHPDGASDLVQETYLRAIRASARFEEKGGGMRSWLFTILHNVFYSKAKREARGPMAVEEFYEADERETPPDEAPPAWDLSSLDWEHVDGEIKQAIEALSPEHREVLLLWGVEGMKYREIAQIMDVPIGTIMSRLHRARKQLSDSLEEFARERGWSGEGRESPTGSKETA